MKYSRCIVRKIYFHVIEKLVDCKTFVQGNFLFSDPNLPKECGKCKAAVHIQSATASNFMSRAGLLIIRQHANERNSFLFLGGQRVHTMQARNVIQRGAISIMQHASVMQIETRV